MPHTLPLRALAPVMAAATALAAAGPPALAQVTGRQAMPRAQAESIAPATSVRSLYVLHCAGCHGVTGAGSATGGVPDMRRMGQFLRIEGGRSFLVSVPGVMGSGLDDRQIADVTNYVLATVARGSVPPGQAPYSEDEVRAARAQPLADVAAVRQRLVARARDEGVPID